MSEIAEAFEFTAARLGEFGQSGNVGTIAASQNNFFRRSGPIALAAIRPTRILQLPRHFVGDHTAYRFFSASISFATG
jgi:hypothetical protein